MSDHVPTDTLQLLHRAKSGDSSALDALLGRHQARLLGRIRLMMGKGARNAAESLDFMQGVMIEALRDFERFDVSEERDFLRWLTEIARNNIRDEVRKRRERVFASFSGTALGEPHARSTLPPEAVARSETEHRVVEAIESLAEDHRTVIELRDLEGLRFAEIGERLGRTENAVQLLHTRALLELGKRLRGLEP